MLDHFVKVAFRLSDEKEDSIFVALKSAGLKLPLALENIHRKKTLFSTNIVFHIGGLPATLAQRN